MTLIFNSIDLFCLWNILLELVLSKQTFNLMTLASVRIVYASIWKEKTQKGFPRKLKLIL